MCAWFLSVTFPSCCFSFFRGKLTLLWPQLPNPYTIPLPTNFFQCTSQKMPSFPAIERTESVDHTRLLNIQKYIKVRLRNERRTIHVQKRAYTPELQPQASQRRMLVLLAIIIGVRSNGSLGTCFDPVAHKLPLCGAHVTFPYTSPYPDVSLEECCCTRDNFVRARAFLSHWFL